MSNELSLTLAPGGNDQTVISQYGEVAGTLEARHDSSPCADRGQNIIVAGFMGGQGAQAGGLGYNEEVSPTVKASPSGGNQVPDIVCVHGAQSPINNTEHANALGTRNNGLENVICQVNKDNEK